MGDLEEMTMKKLALKLNREVVRQLTPKETREAAAGYIYRFSGASCECTQICTFN